LDAGGMSPATSWTSIFDGRPANVNGFDWTGDYEGGGSGSCGGQDIIAEATALHGTFELPVRGDYPTRRLWVRAIKDWEEALTWSPEQQSKARQMDVVVARELAKRGTVVWSSSW
jgi:hypothetical protein